MAETLHLGPVNVYWDLNGTDEALIATEGGASIAFESQTAELMKDETGVTPVDEVHMGQKVTVTIQVADHDVALIPVLFPNVTVIGTTTKRYEFRPATGLKLSSIAKTLTLVKVIDGEESTDPNDTWVICKAAPSGSVTLEYTKDKQSVYAVTFKGYADTSANNRIAYLGDPAVV